MSRKILTIAVTLAIVAGFATPSFAHQSARQRETVSYADLNLNTQKSAQAMLDRIEKAAERTCQASVPDADYFADTLRRRCERRTIANTVRALNVDAVTVAYGQTEEGRSRAVASLPAREG